MTDAEKMRYAEGLRVMAESFRDTGYPLTSEALLSVAGHIEKLERLVAEMAEKWDYCEYSDAPNFVRCGYCGGRAASCGELPHSDDCPVAVAKRLGVIK